MNKPTIFKILYYICFVFFISIWIGAYNSVNKFGIDIRTSLNVILGILNILLVIIFSIKLIKNKLENINILFPIFHLLFMIIITILAVLMNHKLIIPYIQYGYYISFILFNYLLLNIYSILLFNKKKKQIVK